RSVGHLAHERDAGAHVRTTARRKFTDRVVDHRSAIRISLHRSGIFFQRGGRRVTRGVSQGSFSSAPFPFGLPEWISRRGAESQRGCANILQLREAASWNRRRDFHFCWSVQTEVQSRRQPFDDRRTRLSSCVRLSVTLWLCVNQDKLMQRGRVQ